MVVHKTKESLNQKGNEFTAHSKPIQAITDAIEMAVSIFFSYPIYLTENQQMVSIPITSTGEKKKRKELLILLQSK